MGICMSKTGLFMSPDIAVVGGHVTSIGFSGVTLNIVFEASNPNPAELKAKRMVYLLKKASDDTTLTEGVSNQNFTLPPSSTLNNIKIPMTFSYRGLGAATKSIISRGKTRILVSGEITFDAPMAPGGFATSKFNGEINVDMESSSAEYK
jgi:LEA14-like dessication related protein